MTVTISAASQASIASARTRIRNAVSVANAPTPKSPAPPNSPAPFPACFPFSVGSALASSTSLRISVVASSENCLRSSPALLPFCCAMRSPHSGGSRNRLGARPCVWDRRGRVRELRRAGVAGGRPTALAAAVTLPARRLQEARGGQSHDHGAREHGPRLAPAEVLDVVQDPVTVRVPQVSGGPVEAIGRLLGDVGGSFLALIAKLLPDRANVLGRAADALAGLGRALVHLLADRVLRLRNHVLRGLLRLIGGLTDFLSGLV